jgi:hypothetical protein
LLALPPERVLNSAHCPSPRRCEERVRERRGNLAFSAIFTRNEIATPRLRVARDDGTGVPLRRLFHNPDLLFCQAVQFVDQLIDLLVSRVPSQEQPSSSTCLPAAQFD